MAPLFSLSDLWFVCGRNTGRGGKSPAFVSAITSLKFTGLTGTDMSWNAEGQVSKAPTAYVVKDGQYVEG